MTFVVRLTRDEVGRLSGVIEQVKTGRKVRVDGVEAMGRAIEEMIAGLSPDEARDAPQKSDSP